MTPSNARSGRTLSPRRRTLAQQADKFQLYQDSVQVPEAEVRFFRRTFRRIFGREPLRLREDFCGTGAVSCAWVRGTNHRRSAEGIDIDPRPLRWGNKHNVLALQPGEIARVSLTQRDVQQISGKKADIVAAQNFSFFAFKTRKRVQDYFRIARANLKKEGIFVLDMMGGPEVMNEDQVETREINDFRYHWRQRRFDPITNGCQFDIGFSFPDGSEIKRAFTYNWRLWTIPEIRELLAEAGFQSSDVYWEGTRSDGEGDGIFRARKHAASDPAWIAYIVATKRRTC